MRERVGLHSVSEHITEDDTLYVKTTHYNDASLAQNQRIRDANLLDKGSLGIHDNADIRLAISCPSTLEWHMFEKRNKETVRLLTSKNEHERMKGAKQLELIHPEWIVYSRL